MTAIIVDFERSYLGILELCTSSILVILYVDVKSLLSTYLLQVVVAYYVMLWDAPVSVFYESF